MAMDGPVHEHVEVCEANLRQRGLDGLLECHHRNTRAKAGTVDQPHANKAAEEQRREGQGREATKRSVDQATCRQQRRLALPCR